MAGSPDDLVEFLTAARALLALLLRAPTESSAGLNLGGRWCDRSMSPTKSNPCSSSLARSTSAKPSASMILASSFRRLGARMPRRSGGMADLQASSAPLSSLAHSNHNRSFLHQSEATSAGDIVATASIQSFSTWGTPASRLNGWPAREASFTNSSGECLTRTIHFEAICSLLAMLPLSLTFTASHSPHTAHGKRGVVLEGSTCPAAVLKSCVQVSSLPAATAQVTVFSPTGRLNRAVRRTLEPHGSTSASDPDVRVTQTWRVFLVSSGSCSASAQWSVMTEANSDTIEARAEHRMRQGLTELGRVLRLESCVKLAILHQPRLVRMVVIARDADRVEEPRVGSEARCLAALAPAHTVMALDI